MAVVTLSTVVDLAKVKMKWMEQYVSEGLNHKVIPATPKGVYRGLHLVQNIASPRLVDIKPVNDGTHEAVYQSADGFSTTYFDAVGTTITLNLSSASLDNQETIIVLQILYEIGVATTANWLAYPIADWNSLSAAAQGEFVVIGTVNVPAPATNITTAMILPKRRSFAWMNQAPGAVAWTPLLRNSGFEVADLTANYPHSAAFWEFNSTPQAVWTVQQTSPRSGANVLALNYTATGAQSADFSQYIGASVTPGQVIRWQLFIQNLKVPSAGTFIQIIFRFSNTTLNGENDRTVNIPMTAIDGSYREVTETFTVPNNCGNLVSVLISSGLGESTTGVAYRIDDFQIWMESSASQLGGLDANRRGIHTSALVIEDQTDPFDLVFGKAALLTQMADELRMERRDQNFTTQNPIEFALKTARITKLGSDLLNTVARAQLARISIPASTVATALTLVHESIAAGSYGYRTYVSFSGETIHTVNAVWNSGTLQWSKDLNGVVALRQYYRASLGQVKFQFRASDTAWADIGWLDGAIFDGTIGLTLGTDLGVVVGGIGSVQVGTGGVTVAANGHVTVSGTGQYKHGTRTIRWMTNNPRASFLSGASPSNTTSESFGTGSTASGTWFFPLDPWPDNWRLIAARFNEPSTIVGSGGLLTLQERHGGSYTSISSDWSFTNGENGLKTFAGITAATHAFPLGIRMNLQTGSTTTALVSFVELDYDVT